LDDLEWPLAALLHSLYNKVFFRAHHKNLNEDEWNPYYQNQRCSPMTLVSGSVRFMQIFAGLPGGRASDNSGIIKNADFECLGCYIFGTLGNKANIIS